MPPADGHKRAEATFTKIGEFGKDDANTVMANGKES
jgi:hypothetical protein